MKRVIASAFVIIVGIAAILAVVFFIHGLVAVPSSDTLQEAESFAADDVSAVKIDVSVAFINIYESTGTTVDVEFVESRKGLYSVENSGGTLVFSEKQSSFFDRLFRSDVGKYGINIGIPTGKSVSVSINAESSEVTFEGVSLSGNTPVTLGEGTVSFRGVTSSGYISVELEDGDVSIDGAVCAEISADITSGDIFMRDIEAQKAISLTTDSGKVSGFIYGSLDDYTITANVDTGVSELESGGDGPVELIITVGKGSIAVK